MATIFTCDFCGGNGTVASYSCERLRLQGDQMWHLDMCEPCLEKLRGWVNGDLDEPSPSTAGAKVSGLPDDDCPPP